MNQNNTPSRPGSNDHLQYPSRVGDRLYYPDGRVEQFPGKEK